MLDELLNIKKMYLERAEQEIRAARGMLEQSRRAVVKARQALKDYRLWRQKEEKSIYATIIGQQVSLSEVEQTRQHVMALRLHDDVLIKKIDEAESQRKAAQQRLEQAIKEQKKAYKTVEKYKAIIAELQLEEDREKTLHEEKEMEEVRPVEPLAF